MSRAGRCGLCNAFCSHDPAEVSRHHKNSCSRYPRDPSEPMVPMMAAQHLRALAMDLAPIDGEAIVILLDHIGSLERAIDLMKASHENVLRHLPANAVHLVTGPRSKKK